MIRLTRRPHPTIAALQRDIRARTAITIVAYGDSWTFGAAADGWDASETNPDEINSWVTQLKAYIVARNPNATLVNKGVGGRRSSHGVVNLATDVLALSPDYCLLNFGINDWNNNNIVSLTTYVTNMASMIDTLAGVGCRTILWTSGPIATSTEKYGLGGGIDESGFAAKFRDYVDALKALAVERGCPLVDTRGRIIRYWQNGGVISSWFRDAVHFRQPGHDMMFAEWERVLKPRRVLTL